MTFSIVSFIRGSAVFNKISYPTVVSSYYCNRGFRDTKSAGQDLPVGGHCSDDTNNHIIDFETV